MTRTTVALAMLVAGVWAAASATFPVGDSDLYWHLATARETLAHGLMRSDIFSWSAAGAPVTTDQWLGENLLYAGYSAAGWLGVLAVRTLAVGIIVFCIAAAALARRPTAAVASIAISVPAILLSRFLWTERPELMGAAFFALLVLLLQLPGDAPLIALAPLLVVWANVHGSFALGSALAILVAVYGLVADRPRRRGYLVAAAGAILSFVLTPAGVGTAVTPSIHLMDPPRQIQEWSLPDPATPAGALWVIVLGLVVATASVSVRARAVDAILIVPTALLSLLAVRHTPLLAIAATPYLAEHLPLAARAVADIAFGPIAAARRRDRRSAPGWMSAAVGIGGLVIAAAAVVAAPREPDESGFPVGALASLPAGPGLFAQYDWGGWLIWRAPATPVFIDGRLVPYRGDVLRDYQQVLEARPGWRDVVARRGVKWLLVRPSDPVGVRATELGWRVLAHDRSFVLIAVPNSLSEGPP